MNKYRKALCACLLAMMTALSGCSGALTAITPENYTDNVELPLPASGMPEAPIGDSVDRSLYHASLYYKDSVSGMLQSAARDLWLSANRSAATAIVEELMRPMGGETMLAAPKNTRVSFTETSMGCHVVSLRPSEPMDDAGVCALSEALLKTLKENTGAKGVCLLLSGRAAAVGGLPLGVVDGETNLQEYLHSASAAGDNYFRNALVYYPVSGGKWVVPACVSVSVSKTDPAASLLAALAQHPEFEGAVSCVADAKTLLEKPCAYTIEPSGDRILNLYLAADAEAQLTKNGASLDSALAAIVLTLTTFLPETDGVAVYVAAEQLQEVALSNGNVQRFKNSIMKRSDFTDRIAESAKVYFASRDGMLTAETRLMPAGNTARLRSLLLMLMEGPVGKSLFRTFPVGLTNADILGISVENNIASVNLSANAYRLAQAFHQTEEELFVYSLVNTLAENTIVTGVRLFVDGEPVSVLTQEMHLEGVMLPNPGRVSEE